jgi:hypothetical protein
VQDVLKTDRPNYSNDQEIRSFEGFLCLKFPKLIIVCIIKFPASVV